MKNTLKQKNLSSSQKIIVVVIVFILGGFATTKFLRHSRVNRSDSSTSNQTNIGNDESHQQKSISSDTYEVKFQRNQGDTSKADVYLHNTITNQQDTFFMTTTNINMQHYHNGEYHNGNVYLLKRVSDDESTREGEPDELWKYDQQKIGTKLYAGTALDFRIAPDEKFFVVKDDKLHIFEQEKDEIGSYDVTGLGGVGSRELAIGLLDWTSDSGSYWGVLRYGTSPKVVYQININPLDVVFYDVEGLEIGGDYKLNPDNATLVYSDYPVIVNRNALNKFQASKTVVNLYAYDLINGEQQQLATSIAKRFNPKWIADHIVEYDDPSTGDRIQKTIE